MNDYPTPLSKAAPEQKKGTENPAFVPNIPYDSSLTDKAFHQIKTAIKGHKLDPKKITLENVEGGVYEFYGMLHLKIKPEIKQSENSGTAAAGGESITAGTLNTKIDKVMQDFAFDTTMQQAIFRDITLGPSKGFGLSKGKITLPTTKTFIEQENCGPCNGQGRAICPQCQSKGQMPCNKCRGSRFSPCVMCRGTGRTQTAGSVDMCNYCKGQGQMSCDLCRSVGFVPCTKCGTSGQITCTACAATGKISRVSHVTFTLTPQFEMNDQHLPTSIQQMLGKGCENLATKKELDIKPLDEEMIEALIKERKLPSPQPDDFSIICYKALCPSATFSINLAGKKRFNASTSGYKSRIISCDNFLDMLVNKPMKLLQKAASDSRSTANNIKQAVAWKTARAAIIASIKFTPKKAAAALMAENPIGLSQKYAKGLTFYAYQAIKRITRLPRYIALGVSTIVNTALYTMWFNQNRFGLLGSLLETEGNIVNSVLVDLGLLCFLAVATIGAIRFTASLSLQKMFKNLGLEKTTSKWPKAGKTALYTWGMQFILIIIIAAFVTTKKPEWIGLLGL